jgi:hypothetical protein
VMLVSYAITTESVSKIFRLFGMAVKILVRKQDAAENAIVSKISLLSPDPQMLTPPITALRA